MPIDRPCPDCNGFGEIEHPRFNPFWGDLDFELERCERCNGHGMQPWTEREWQRFFAGEPIQEEQLCIDFDSR